MAAVDSYSYWRLAIKFRVSILLFVVPLLTLLTFCETRECTQSRSNFDPETNTARIDPSPTLRKLLEQVMESDSESAPSLRLTIEGFEMVGTKTNSVRIFVDHPEATIYNSTNDARYFGTFTPGAYEGPQNFVFSATRKLQKLKDTLNAGNPIEFKMIIVPNRDGERLNGSIRCKRVTLAPI